MKYFKKRHFVIIIFMLILILTGGFYCAHKKTYTKVIKEETAYRYGRIIDVCEKCNVKVKEKIGIPYLEENYIYITGTDIKENFVITAFTQSAVDTYNIIYTEKTALGENNPFILGHDYKSLGKLYQTKVGEYIILNINGTIEIYEVMASEYGIQNLARTTIIGQNTGISIWHTYEEKTLHLYTCYGEDENGRWIVLARKIY